MTATRPAHPAQPIKLYGFSLSGHVHRVRLFLEMLGLPFENIEVDLPHRQHRGADFLARNAFGQVPVIEDGELVLPDSNAILVYLNERYAPDPARWMPRDPAALRACSAGSRWRPDRSRRGLRWRGSSRCSDRPAITPTR